MTTLYNNDLTRAALRDRRVCVLGYGAQGRAQALNLRDSGVDLVVGLRASSPHRSTALKAGLVVRPPSEAVRDADVIAMLVPDMVQSQVYRETVEPNLKAGACLLFAHGYAIHFGKILPRQDLDVAMVAPMGIGEQVREIYRRGAGTPALLAVQQDATGNARKIAESYAAANGHGHAGVITTTFAEETETDLFAEQAVLCGGMNHLVTAAFETLVEAGYQPEVAYFCCLHEVRFIAEMVQRRGIAGMRESISMVAEYGDYTRGAGIIGDDARAAMRTALQEIRTGSFTDELDAEVAAGRPTIKAGRRAAREHLLETVGAKLRGRMDWLNEGNE